jgi:hypothetical protein
MGIAAYNRGTAAMSAQIDRQRRAVEFEVMETLNALPKYADAGLPFGPIQFIYDTRGFWVAECPITGFGFFYDTLHEAVKRWRVTITWYVAGTWLAEVRS